METKKGKEKERVKGRQEGRGRGEEEREGMGKKDLNRKKNLSRTDYVASVLSTRILSMT